MRGLLFLLSVLWVCAPLCSNGAETPPPLPPLGGVETPASASAEQASPKDRSLLDLFRTGGPVMYPLALASVLMVAIALYLQIALSRRALLPAEELAVYTSLLRQGHAEEAWRQAAQGTSLFSRSLAAAMGKAAHGRPAMESAATDLIYYEEGKLLSWVHYLNVISTLAPMLGLLGTVVGMILSFEQLKSGRATPTDLAGGIGEAMIATATGLILAIPAMFFFFHYRNRLSTQAAEVGRQVGLLLDLWSGQDPHAS